MDTFGYLVIYVIQLELLYCSRVHGFRAAIVVTASGYESRHLSA